MDHVIRLKWGERPSDHERHALVVASATLPPTGVPYMDRGSCRTYFAANCENDIALMVRRARVWADMRGIPNVYLRCQS
jgi:hypothetical protein